MVSDGESPGGIDLAEYLVATSEDGTPEDTFAELFDIELDDETSLSDSFAAQFLSNDVVIRANDYFLGDETRHELHFDDRMEYVPCVGDAFVAAALIDTSPVVLRSYDPVTGEPVRFEITDDDTEVIPSEHVVSIGMAKELFDAESMISAAAEMDAIDPQQYYDDPLAHCQYINAFESVATYEEWTQQVSAVTVALPGEPLMEATRQAVAGEVFD